MKKTTLDTGTKSPKIIKKLAGQRLIIKKERRCPQKHEGSIVDNRARVFRGHRTIFQQELFREINLKS